jgi:hypothetical protein
MSSTFGMLFTVDKLREARTRMYFHVSVTVRKQGDRGHAAHDKTRKIGSK